jgi:hypothetical protein
MVSTSLQLAVVRVNMALLMWLMQQHVALHSRIMHATVIQPVYLHRAILISAVVSPSAACRGQGVYSAAVRG